MLEFILLIITRMKTEYTNIMWGNNKVNNIDSKKCALGLEITRRFSNHESRLLSRSHTFAIIVILDLKIHQSMWIHWPFFPKTWTKGHWPLDDLWPHVEVTCVTLPKDHCVQVLWQYINVCGYSDQYCKIPHTYYILHTYILRTYYVQNEWSHSLLLNSVQARQKLLCNGNKLGNIQEANYPNLPIEWGKHQHISFQRMVKRQNHRNNSQRFEEIQTPLLQGQKVNTG